MLRYVLLALIVLFSLCACGEEEAENDDSNDTDETISDLECEAHSECPSGMDCQISQSRCVERCTDDEECPEHRPYCTTDEDDFMGMGAYCLDEDNSPRQCDPLATGDDCECGIGDESAYRIKGSGEDCEVLEEDLSVCFEQYNTCLNGCDPRYFEYDLGDGESLIALGLQGQISPGWEYYQLSDCPAIEVDGQ